MEAVTADPQGTPEHSVSPQSRPVHPRPGPGPWPLSFAQERIWFLDQLAAGSPVYNVPIAVRLTGRLDVPALKNALRALVARHEALRTVIVSLDGIPAQAVQGDKVVDLPVVDLSSVPEQEKQCQLEREIAEFCRRPFDLERDLLLRPCLIRCGEQDCTLVLNLHHICADGPSMGILHQELVAFYQAFSRGEQLELPPLPVQYADFAEWQRSWLTRDALSKQLSYWRKELEGAPPYLELPTDFARPAVQTHKGARRFFELPAAWAVALRRLSRQQGVSLFMTLLAGFEALLHHYTSQEDIVVGTPVANRPRAEIEGLIGFFLNTLALRVDFSGDPTFRELLMRVRKSALEAYGNYELPFELLLEELKPQRDLGRSPVFQVMFTLQSAPTATIQLRDLKWASRELDTGTAKFDLFLVLQEKGQELGGYVEYNTDLFQPATIERMLAHFERLLDAASRDPDQKISLLPLLGEPERHQLVVGWNETRASYPSDQCIHQLFEAQVQRTPERVALICGNARVTYRELNRRANRLARQLRSRGVGREALVGVFLERSVEMVVALLGVLKAGGAYVPLDPSYPADWLALLLEDSRASVVVTQEKFLVDLPSQQASVLCLDRDGPEMERQEGANLDNVVAADNLAYVIYTSGSTGAPKGVLGLHRGAVNRFAWMWKAYPFAEGEVCCQKTSLNFVDSIWEIFGPLLQGVSSVIIPDEVVKDPIELARVLDRERVSRIVLVPSLLRVLLDTYSAQAAGQHRPKLWISSGEALEAALGRRFREVLPESHLLNLYGSSEVSADVTCHEVSRIAGELPTVPIGAPIANTQVYVLNSRLQVVPVGIEGEIYVGGDGLARGYHRRPELTAERFIPSPFEEFPGKNLYRTGDRGRRHENGEIEYLGRVDHQVKIRGFRVELGQIEATLTKHKAVQSAVAAIRESEVAGKWLVAYVVANPGETPAADELCNFLRERLPEYMVPAQFAFLSGLPLMPNGKVDRGALPQPEQEPMPTHRGELLAPRNQAEAELAEILQALLGRGPIGVDENFFDLGAHSLLVSRLLLRVNQVFERRLSLADIFRAPTVEQLARLLCDQDAPSHFQGVVPIWQTGSRPPLFWVRGGPLFRPLAQGLGTDQPFLGLNLPLATLDRLPKPHRFEDLASAFVRVMREVQPQGPYFLAGLCVNGVMAYEMARQLSEQGEEVGLVALFDSQNPACYWDYKNNRLRYALAMTRFHLAKLMRVRASDVSTYLGARWEGIQRRWNSIKWRVSHQTRRPGNIGIPGDLDPIVIPSAWGYRPKPYSGSIVLFQSTDWPKAPYWDYELGWREFARGGVEIHRIPGSHLEMFREPNFALVAEKLNSYLRDAFPHPSTEPVSESREVGAR